MFYDDQQHERQENSGNNQSLTEVKFGTTMPGAPYRLIVTGSLKREKKNSEDKDIHVSGHIFRGHVLKEICSNVVHTPRKTYSKNRVQQLLEERVLRERKW